MTATPEIFPYIFYNTHESAARELTDLQLGLITFKNELPSLITGFDTIGNKLNELAQASRQFASTSIDFDTFSTSVKEYIHALSERIETVLTADSLFVQVKPSTRRDGKKEKQVLILTDNPFAENNTNKRIEGISIRMQYDDTDEPGPAHIDLMELEHTEDDKIHFLSHRPNNVTFFMSSAENAFFEVSMFNKKTLQRNTVLDLPSLQGLLHTKGGLPAYIRDNLRPRISEDNFWTFMYAIDGAISFLKKNEGKDDK